MAFIHQIFSKLSLLSDPSYDKEELKTALIQKDFVWEEIVKAGSKQLVLPTIFCNLESKGLIKYIPKDLCNYLEELTNINRNRNITLLEEIRDISKVFKKNYIDHVFLKGGALLASGYYNDLGERMVGDIDVLVHPDQLFKAQDLLVKNGYDEANKSLTDKYVDQKHLPRLISDSKLASVEIHRKLLHKEVKGQLSPIKVLENKQIINNLTIPSNLDLLKHTILNFQINDYGYEYNYLGLRNSYDTLILLPHVNKLEIDSLTNQRIFRSFLNKTSNYFINVTDYGKTWADSVWNSLFVLKQKYRLPNTIWFKTVNMFNILSLILNRLILFVTNRNYRQESFRDRKRILKLIKDRF